MIPPQVEAAAKMLSLNSMAVWKEDGELETCIKIMEFRPQYKYIMYSEQGSTKKHPIVEG